MIECVLDLSHHNHVSSFDAMREAGFLAIVHKVTQGVSYVDPCYHERKQAAKDAGLAWGAYHFGERGEPGTQVRHFLDTAHPSSEDLLVLDWEDYGEASMTLSEAEVFVRTIEDHLGLAPGLYSGQSFLTEQTAQRTTSPLQHSWLWLARYSSDEPIVPPLWSRWTLWQFSDTATVPGVEGPCDINRFPGTEDQLRRLWSGRDL
jgi:lysozyme